jgi:hypothetical protein
VKERNNMIDICENCYEEANLVKVKGLQVCSSCVKEMSGSSSASGDFEDEIAVLENTYDMPGVMSDDDVVDMFRDEYLGY